MQKNIQPMYTLPSQMPIAAAAEFPTPTTAPPAKRSRKTKESKRRQVKNACINCQKACKKCDEGRACLRCIKLGIESSCVDSPRKERLRGVKRGPYKKRQPKNVTSAANKLYANDQDKTFHLDQDFKWLDNTQVVAQQQYHQPQPIQYQPFNQSQYTTYQDQQYHQYQQQTQQQKSACFASDVTIGNDSYDTTPYYSPSPIDQQRQQASYQQQSVNSTPSPLTNYSVTDYYASPVSSSLSSISPVSSTMPLHQDVLQNIIAMNDLIPADMDVFPKQEELEFDDSLLLMPLQDSPILNWSTVSTPCSDAYTFAAAPQLAQPVYHQQQYSTQQQDSPQQQTQYIPFY